MGLQKQILSLPFTQGLDTKTDARLSPKPSRLENSVFTTGDLNKHAGRKALPSAIDTGGSQSAGEAIFAFNQELVRINGGTTYGLAPALSEWTTKPGGNNYCTLSARTLVSTQSGTGNFDTAIVGNIGVVAWAQSGMHVAVYDVTTGAYYQTGSAIVGSSVSTSDAPRLVVLGSKVVVLWASFSAGNLYSAVIDTSAPSTAPTQSTLRTDLWTSATSFDAIAYNASFAVLVYPTTGTDLKAIGVDGTGAVTASPAPTTYAGALSGSGLTRGVHVTKNSAGVIIILYGDTNLSRTRYFNVDSTLAQTRAFTLVVASGNWNGGGGQFFTATSIELTPNTVTTLLTTGAADQFVGSVSFGANGAISSAFSTLPGTAGLWVLGDLIAYNGTAVFGAVGSDTTTLFGGSSGIQASAYLVTVTGRTLAKGVLYASPIANTAVCRTCRSWALGQSVKFCFWQQERTAYASTTGGVTAISTLAIRQLTATNVPANQVPINQVGASIYIGGGYPRLYDGVLVGETGFTLYPLAATPVDAGAGGNLSAGTYQWRFLYSWYGANGELIRGPVSPGQSLTLAASHSATLSVYTMPLAMRDLLVAGGNSLIEVYRTQANGTVFYRQSSLTAGPQNVTATASAISISDNVSDATLATGELLYTNGGILDWEAPPAYSSACAHQNRLVVLPSEDTNAFMPSSEWQTGEIVRFSSFTKQYTPSDRGPLTGVASMDGKLILLTQFAAYVTYGDGPDELGNNLYPPVQLIAGVDAGPLPGSPCVTTPVGVLYQSTKGLTLIDRALNQQFIGADVEAYTLGPWVVRSIVVHPRLQQIHIQVDDGRDIPGAQMGTLVPSQGGFRLVYDYYYQQWSIDPAWGAQDACIYQNTYVQTRSDGVCLQETPGLYLDQGSAYGSVVETPWLKLAGAIQGFQRLWYVTLVGTYYSDFTLQLDVAYDYAQLEPGVPDYDANDSVSLNGAGQFTPGGTFRIRHHLGKKCEAVKFRIRDVSILGNGQGMGLSELALEYGVKKGVFKLPASKTA